MRVSYGTQNQLVLVLEPDAEFLVAGEAVKYVNRDIIPGQLKELDLWFEEEIDILSFARSAVARNDLFNSEVEVHTIPFKDMGETVMHCLRVSSQVHPDQLTREFSSRMLDSYYKSRENLA